MVPESTKIRPTDTHPTTLATELAQHAIKPPFWAIFPALGELSRAHAAASAPDDPTRWPVGEVTRPGGLFCKRCSALG